MDALSDAFLQNKPLSLFKEMQFGIKLSAERGPGFVFIIKFKYSF